MIPNEVKFTMEVAYNLRDILSRHENQDLEVVVSPKHYNDLRSIDYYGYNTPVFPESNNSTFFKYPIIVDTEATGSYIEFY